MYGPNTFQANQLNKLTPPDWEQSIQQVLAIRAGRYGFNAMERGKIYPRYRLALTVVCWTKAKAVEAVAAQTLVPRPKPLLYSGSPGGSKKRRGLRQAHLPPSGRSHPQSGQ